MVQPPSKPAPLFASRWIPTGVLSDFPLMGHPMDACHPIRSRGACKACRPNAILVMGHGVTEFPVLIGSISNLCVPDLVEPGLDDRLVLPVKLLIVKASNPARKQPASLLVDLWSRRASHTPKAASLAGNPSYQNPASARTCHKELAA